MLKFDDGTIKRLQSPKTKTEDKLYLISRYIEEKYGFTYQPNYWDNKFDLLNDEERVFYKVWLWICYAEWESLVSPISEFDEVFGEEKRRELLEYLENEKIAPDNLESHYTLDGAAGKILLDWGLENLNTTYHSI